jgi:phosphohistidine phosphatase
MLRLALLRHSEAHPQAQGGDKERSLTKAGRKMATRMGKYCHDMALVPDLALVSPAQRAKETYELVAAEIGRDLKVTFDPALYNATSTTIKMLVAEVSSDHKLVLVTGHNPGIAESAIALSGQGDPGMLAEMRAHFPAPALAIIDFEMETWAEIAAGRGYLDRFVTKTMLSG